jgi:uncharacterized repeat protein (TIGR03837 family)
MSSDKMRATTLVIFCKVVDNYGDIGICWRLARQFQREHGIEVTLWVDDLQSFRRICPEVAVDVDTQCVENVQVRHWRNQEGQFSPDAIADIVIEFFACDIPPGYIAAMAQCEPRPVWLNLEGLSAEEWVEGCHTLPSPHPRLPLTKHFFFPGFTSKTGGLLHESSLEEQREQFLHDEAEVSAFLGRLGLTSAEMTSLKVSLFCYPHAPVSMLLDAWQAGSTKLTCLVPEGVATGAIEAFLEEKAVPGTARTRGALTVRVLPFVPQPDYDRLLWACDVNFVRGEDSFVRAQWANKPFIWHIYPQDKNLHHVKLDAFLRRYANNIESAIALSRAWNGVESAGEMGNTDWVAVWARFHADLPILCQRARDWRQEVLVNGDLVSNLLTFARSRRSAAGQNAI